MKETNDGLIYLSVPKKQKLGNILRCIGNTSGKTCLDIGSDNGIISYFLRKNGGEWFSVDIDEETVNSIRDFVGVNVFRVDGGKLPFRDDFFDTAVIVDFLEHIEDDALFIRELHRVMKKNSTLVVNVPRLRAASLLGRLKDCAGYTDDMHGHLRPGYTVPALEILLKDRFNVREHTTYIGFFSELVDAISSIILFTLSRGKTGKKGMVVTRKTLGKKQKFFKSYRLLSPLLESFSALDGLMPSREGANLMLRATCVK